MGEVSRTVVAEIRDLQERIEGNLRRTVDDAIRIGELLTTAKRQLGHGDFLLWIEAEMPFKERTAQTYMRLYEYREMVCKSASVADLQSAERLVAALESAEDQRKRQAQQRRVEQYEKTGKKPADWDRSDDYALARHKATETFKAAVRSEPAPEPQPEPQRPVIDTEELLERADRTIRIGEQAKRLDLSDDTASAAQRDIFEIMADYIRAYDTLSRRVEAAHNLMKWLRTFVHDLQGEPVQPARK